MISREIVEAAEKRQEKQRLQHEVERAEPAGGAKAVEGHGMRDGDFGRQRLGVQQLRLDAEDAEDQREHRAAEIE